MQKVSRICLLGIAITGLTTITVPAATTYQLDNGTNKYQMNVSDTTEPHDNWVGNVFTVQAGANRITAIDYGIYTSSGAPNSASVVLYRLWSGSGGNPALGATRVYTQTFTPRAGDGQYWYLDQVTLTTPVDFTVGDKFLVALFMPNVIALAPNDKYPFILDTSGVAAGTYWDRSDPGLFNLDDLSAAKPINQALVTGGWAPDPGHIVLRAEAIAVPEPSNIALIGLGAAALVIFRRRAS